MNESIEAPAWLSALLVGVAALSLMTWLRILRRFWRGKPAVPGEPRRPVPWGVDGAFLAGLSLFAALMSLITPEAVSDAAQPLGLQDAASFALVSGLLALLAIAWQRMNVCASHKDFGAPESPGQAAKDILLGVTFCAAMLPIVYGVQSLIVLWLGLPSSHPTVETLLADPSPDVIAAAILMAVVIAPIYEELAFRVLLQGWLERIGGPTAWWPVVVASALFAGAHVGQGYAPAPLFVLSLGIGYLYRQTRRAAPCIAMHMAFNALSLATAIGVATAGSAAAS